MPKKLAFARSKSVHGCGRRGPDTDAAMGKSKNRARKADRESGHWAANVDRIDLADRFEEASAQAIAIASLLMEADADVAVQDAAGAVRDLVERIRNIGRVLLKTSDTFADDARS
jgi:hypothetical protein